MNPKRDAAKIAKGFHAAWLKFLLNSTLQTLRRVAHELADLEKANERYRDGGIFHLLRVDLEYVIQDVGGTQWTVEKSKRDLRGRRAQSKRKVHIDPELQRALRDRFRIQDSD